MTRTRSQIGKASRRKGHTFERWVVAQLRAIGFADARRQPQSQIKELKRIAETCNIPMCLTDVVATQGDIRLGIECKHRKVLPPIAGTLQQAADDCGTSNYIPVAIHKGGAARGVDSIEVAVSRGSAIELGASVLIGDWDCPFITMPWYLFLAAIS